MFNVQLHRFQEKIFNITFFILYGLYFIIALGLSTSATKYLETLDNLIKVYISLYIILRFNPFRHTRFTEFDRKVVFTSAFYVLATTTINTFVKSYYNKAFDTAKKNLVPDVSVVVQPYN